MAKPLYRKSPKGIAVYPWVNKPDTKFNDEGIYKTGLRLVDDAAQEFKAVVDGFVEASFAEITEDMTKAEAKKWSRYVPYTIEEDDDGNQTGAIVFQFRQNAVIHLKDGSNKPIQIGIYDAKDDPTNVPVWGGAEIAVLFKPRTIKMASSKAAGTRLDFLKVQVIQLADRSSKGGFGEVEGGYVDEGEVDAAASSSSSTTSSDY